ncbi:MAG: hypothetical protein GF344_20520 [Chitinivibrionales bacterium]|nr:hypothetical protein [Chitinivibrionales bacterium]MBD3358987.1 hypothetical protein [Chitinivibrionales bacterium]
MPEEHEIRIVAKAIERYLHAHPHAADTVDGVAIWWLTRQRFVETLDTVEQALEYLVATGDVKKTLTADGNPLYSLSKVKR